MADLHHIAAMRRHVSPRLRLRWTDRRLGLSAVCDHVNYALLRVAAIAMNDDLVAPAWQRHNVRAAGCDTGDRQPTGSKAPGVGG